MPADRQPSDATNDHESLRRLGKFDIVRMLGAGGMGAVFLATDTELKRSVALKVLPKDRSENPRLVRRFKAEAQAVASLRHDNIVAIYEAGEIDGFPYLALEYVDGIDLQSLIQKRGVIPPKRSLKIIRQVAAALQHAYERNIVHRDIKPSNLLIKPDGTCKLTDLGLARSLDDTLDASITRAGTTVGTVDYISPEQACDSKAADIRSDIYSLGCTWYHMLTGEPPYAEGDLQTKIRAHVNAPPPNPRQLNPSVPEAYVAVIHRMMAKRPQDRYQTPQELLDDLDQVAGMANQLSAQLFDEPVATDDDDESAWGDEPEAESRSAPATAVSPRGDGGPRGEASPRRGGSPGAVANTPNETSSQRREVRTRREAPPPGEGGPPAGSKSAERSSTSRSKAAEPEATPSPRSRTSGAPSDSPAPIPQKLKLNSQAPAAAAPARGRSRGGPSRTVVSGGDDTSGTAKSETTPQRLAASELKPPTGISVDLDVARIVLIGSIVAGILGLFWWAMSRGTHWGTSGQSIELSSPAPAPPVPEAAPTEPAPPPGAAPLVAEADYLAGHPKSVRRVDFIFDGTDDLPGPDSAQVRALVPDWVYAIHNASLEGLPVVTVSQPPQPRGVSTLAAAFGPFHGRERLIEIVGDGPYVLDPTVLRDLDRVVIRAAAGSRPVVIARGRPESADQGLLQLRGGVLELEGLHILAITPREGPSQTLFSVMGGTVVLRRCTVTQSPDSGPVVVCQALASSGKPFPPRVLIEHSLLRGPRLTAVRGRGQHLDLIVGGSLVSAGNGPVIAAEVLPGEASPAAASTRPDSGEQGAGSSAAPTARPAETPPPAVVPEPPAAIRVLGSLCAAQGVGIEVQQPSGTAIEPCEILLRRSIWVGGPEATLLALPAWPVRASQIAGQSRAARLGWRQERTQLVAWPTLLRYADRGASIPVTDPADWEQFWGQPLEAGALAVRTADVDLSDFRSLDRRVCQRLAAAVPEELSQGSVVGVTAELPLPPEAQLDQQLLLGARPRLPPGYTELAEPPVPTLRYDLRSLRQGLNQLLNSPEVPDGAHVQLTGIGIVGIAPVVLRGKSLRLECLQGGEGAPFILRPEPNKGEPPEAVFLVENGRLDLIGMRLQAPPSKAREFPSRLLLARNADVSLRNCWLEGSQKGDPPGEALVELASGEGTQRRYAYITDSCFVGAQPLLAANIDRKLLVINNTVLASRGDCLALTSTLGATVVEPPQAGWAVLQNCSFLTGGAAIRLAGLTTGRHQPAAHLLSQECLFAIAPGSTAGGAVLLAQPESMSADNLFDWWEERNAYAVALKRYRQTSPTAAPSEQDFARDWTGFWPSGHVEGPVTGNNAVLFKTVLTSLDGFTPAAAELLPACQAFHGARDGGPIGVRSGQIGPRNTPLHGTPSSPSSIGQQPTGPARVDF